MTTLDFLKREREKLKHRMATCESVEVKAWYKRELASISAKILACGPNSG